MTLQLTTEPFNNSLKMTLIRGSDRGGHLGGPRLWEPAAVEVGARSPCSSLFSNMFSPSFLAFAASGDQKTTQGGWDWKGQTRASAKAPPATQSVVLDVGEPGPSVPPSSSGSSTNEDDLPPFFDFFRKPLDGRVAVLTRGGSESFGTTIGVSVMVVLSYSLVTLFQFDPTEEPPSWTTFTQALPLVYPQIARSLVRNLTYAILWATDYLLMVSLYIVAIAGGLALIGSALFLVYTVVLLPSLGLWWSVSLHIMSTRRMAMAIAPRTTCRLPTFPFYLVDHAFLLSPFFGVLYYTSLVSLPSRPYVYTILGILLAAGAFNFSIAHLGVAGCRLVAVLRRCKLPMSWKKKGNALAQGLEETERLLAGARKTSAELGGRQVQRV